MIDAIPAGAAKLEGADRVIGVDVGCCLCRVPPIEDGIDAINRATEIMSFYLNRESRQKADILIEPAVKHMEWTDFLKYEEIIREGEKATGSAIGEIRMMLNPGWRRRVSQRIRESAPWSKREEHGRDLPVLAPVWLNAETARLEGRKDKDMLPGKALVLK